MPVGVIGRVAPNFSLDAALLRVSMKFGDRTRPPNRYLTVSVPCIPASRWPGTVQ